MRRSMSWAAALLLAGATVALAQPATSGEASNLDELLRQIRERGNTERVEQERREAEFRSRRAEQAQLLEAARAAKARAEQRGTELEAAFEANEARIPELEETLRSRMGTLGELFGVVRQVAGDTRGVVEASLVSAEIPGRQAFLEKLGQSRELPSLEDLEGLWFALQQEMTETGKVTRFTAPVVGIEGGERNREVIRIGTFTAIADSAYLQYLPETGKLTELGRQPPSRHVATVAAFEQARDGLVGVAIDPSRGQLLRMLIQTPDLGERVEQGGLVGYLTIGLGLIGLLIVAQRIGYLAIIGGRMRAEAKRDTHGTDNPLGRVLSVYQQHRHSDVETLELKLDEAILRETPAIERGNSLIRVISVVAPLLGLLGTVTGMIRVFEAITLFGAGDPRLMADGISQALVTTVLGLAVAIPMTLLHSVVSGRSKSLIQILEEESAGLVAAHAEREEDAVRADAA